MISFPSSTVTLVEASIGNLISDPGLLAILVFAAALPVAFWLIHKIIGLFPKSGGRRNS